MKKRAIAFLVVTFVGLASYILAVFAFGFRKTCGRWFTMHDINQYFKDNPNGDLMPFIRTAYSLMVVGMVFISLAIIASIILIVIAYKRNRVMNKWDAYFWLQLSIVALVIASFAFMLSGELVFLNRFYNYHYDHPWINDGDNCLIPSNLLLFDQFWNTGYMAGMLIFTIIPVLIIWIPFMFRAREPQPYMYAKPKPEPKVEPILVVEEVEEVPVSIAPVHHHRPHKEVKKPVHHHHHHAAKPANTGMIYEEVEVMEVEEVTVAGKAPVHHHKPHKEVKKPVHHHKPHKEVKKPVHHHKHPSNKGVEFEEIEVMEVEETTRAKKKPSKDSSGWE